MCLHERREQVVPVVESKRQSLVCPSCKRIQSFLARNNNSWPHEKRSGPAATECNMRLLSKRLLMILMHA